MTEKLIQVRPVPESLIGDDVEDLSDYRVHLQAAEQKSQEDFDKTVLSLSGGALGISFVFLKDVIGPNPVFEPRLLFAAWVAWGISTFCVLASYYVSHLALRKAIKQIDQKTIRKGRPGGLYSVLTAVLNAAGAILFLVGVCVITLFASANLKGLPNAKSQTTTTTTATIAPANIPASGAGTTIADRRSEVRGQ